MSAYDIIQLIVAILSLVATIVISIVLYKLDRKREKQLEAQNEKTRLLNLEHEAEIFIIKNGDEIEYLPLCVVANNLNGTQKHRRAIYNNFNLCSKELQEIILRKQNVYLKKITAEDWFSLCNKKFEEEIAKYQLGKNMYYDNAKYVTHCYKYYGKDKLPDIDISINTPDYVINENCMEPRDEYKCSLFFYIGRYFDYLSDVKQYKNPHEIQIHPPCDCVYEIIKGSKDNIYSYWCAVQMRYLCSQFRDLCLDGSLYCNSYSDAIEIEPEYYEDLYYCAIYELYITFGQEFECD